MLLFPTSLRFWIIPALVASLSILGFLFEPLASDVFAYQRTAIQSGEIWRLVTGHFLHTNVAHLGLNLLGLGLLWALHGDYYSTLRLIVVLSMCSVLTATGIYVFSPQMLSYVGLSGVLHGLFVWGVCLDIVKRERTAWLLLIGISVKIGYEQMGGNTQDIAELINASVAIDAHLFGACSGLLLGIGCVVFNKLTTAQENTAAFPEQ